MSLQERENSTGLSRSRKIPLNKKEKNTNRSRENEEVVEHILDIPVISVNRWMADSVLLDLRSGTTTRLETRGRLDLAVPFTPFTPNRQNSNQVVLEHLYWRTPATPSSMVV